MKTAVISTLLALAALGSAAPGSPAPPAPTASLSAGYYNYVTVTLQGAGSGESYYYYYLPTDGTSIQLYNNLSVSHIYTYGIATCTFRGIDGSETVTRGYDSQDVGPPQTQVSASCIE